MDGTQKLYDVLSTHLLTLAGSTTLFELRSSPSKGHGLFATQNIKRGTRIISERALLTLPPDHPPLTHLWDQLQNFTPEQQLQYAELACNMKVIGPNAVDSIRDYVVTCDQYSGLTLEAAVEVCTKLVSFPWNARILIFSDLLLVRNLLHQRRLHGT